jgi:hypothetical protein
MIRAGEGGRRMASEPWRPRRRVGSPVLAIVLAAMAGFLGPSCGSPAIDSSDQPRRESPTPVARCGPTPGIVRFAPPVHYGASETGVPAGAIVQGIAAGDFNGDGRQDLVTAVYWDYCGPGCRPSPGGGTLLPGRAEGGFAVPGAGYGRGSGNLAFVVVADVDRDGRADAIAGLWNSSEMWVLLGNAGGVFQPEHFVNAPERGLRPVALTTGDFTGDGRPDLAVDYSTNLGGEALHVLTGDGAGDFRSEVAPQPLDEKGFQAIGAADFDRDGRLDLALRSRRSTVPMVLFGAGDGTFATPVTIGPDALTSGSSVFLAIGDFNHDGTPDLADAGSNLVNVFLGRGDGSFQPPARYDIDAAPLQALAASDLDGNGGLDLVVVAGPSEGREGLPAALVLLGHCDGSFRPAQGVDGTQGAPRAPGFTPGDFNGDGQPDLAFGDSTGHLTVLMNRSH